MFEESLEVVVAVGDAVAAVLPDARHLLVASLREQQSAARGRLADPQVPLAAH